MLREARRRAGLSQAALARRSGIAQSVISIYESGGRQPSVPTLAALVAATGHRLDLNVEALHGPQRLTGPVGRRLRRRRLAVHRAAARHGLTVLGVFGSVARGEERPDSDVDLLVELPDGIGLIGLARAQQDLETTIGDARVDLVPAADLKPGVRRNVYADLVAL